MPSEGETPTYQIQDGEKITSAMAYTDSHLIWGEVVTKEVVRVSTWLRTPAIPLFIFFHNAHVITFSGPTPKPQSFTELHVPSSQVLAFHVKPPAQDPLDYDPNEPMRKMEPTTALVGHFRFDGYLRMSTHTDIERYLDVSKETFTTMYDVEISQPAFPTMRAIHVLFVLVRSERVLFSRRTA